MKVLTIDDRPELLDIGGYFGQQREQVILTKDYNNNPRLLYDVANEVKRKAPDPESDEKCIIFLNLFLECQDDEFNWQQDQAGIALLKFLRMMGVNHHVVLVSPYSFEYLIKQDPGNYIIASQGVSLTEPKYNGMYDFNIFEVQDDVKGYTNKQVAGTKQRFNFTNRFAKYLYELMIKYGWIEEKEQKRKVKKKEAVALHVLAENTFDANNLISYLLSGFELPTDERHNWANWWGIIQLCDVHRGIFRDEFNFGDNKSYPGSIDDSLKSLRNFQLRKIYQTNENFQRALASLHKSDLKEYLDLCNEEIKERRGQIQDIESSIEATESEEAIENLKEDLNIAEGYLNEDVKERDATKEKLDKLKRVIVSENVNLTIDYINEKRFNDREPTPQILYIDDQAHEGWSDIFQIMLFGEKGQPEHVFKSIQDIDDDIDSFYKNTIKHEIKRNNGPDLILLDLRLLNEGGTLQNIHKISGARLLKRIREDFPGQPIMMTTASNKAWSVRELSKLGIDCYWTKEGIDVSQSLSNEDRKKYSANNYLSFLKYVKALSGKNYQLLKEIERLITKISNEDNQYWWKNPNWMHGLGSDAPGLYPNQILTDPDIIKKNLTNVLFLMRQYFYLVHFQHKYNNKSWFYPSLIIQHLGKIIEVIHSFEDLKNVHEHRGNKKFNPSIGTVLRPRQDELGIDIYRARNRASHFDNARCINIKDVHKMVNWIDRYLLETPNCVV